MLYSQMFTELIDRKYSKEGQLEILKNVQKEDLRKLIQEIGFGIFQTGNEYITKAELMKLPATKVFLKLLPEDTFQDSIKGIMLAFYFKETLKKSDDDYEEDTENFAIEFLHKSLREYMTAEKIFNTLNYEFLDKRQNGNYIIDDYKAGLTLIQDLFGKQSFTNEINVILIEIIFNSKVERQELVQRLFTFFPDYIKNDFIDKYDYGFRISPMQFSINCFRSFWYIISILGLDRNYLKSTIVKQKVALFFRMLSVFDESILDFDFSFQDFSSMDLTAASFNRSKFFETKFDRAYLDRCEFYRCDINKSSFVHSYFDDTIFRWCTISDSTFNEAFISFELGNTSIIDCSFENSRIFDLKTKDFKNNDNGVIFTKDDGTVDDTDYAITRIDNSHFNGAMVDKLKLESIVSRFPSLETQKFTIRVESTTKKRENKAEKKADLPADYKRLVF